ncbi:tripartite tricarboxylate transporter substrate binding protein [soil metagenome]
MLAGAVSSVILGGLSWPARVFAQGWPAKPIRFIVPYPPGGPLDATARAMAELLKPALGVMIIENRPGAGGNIGADLCAKAAPDGYTIVMGAVATHAINPSLFARMPYDAVKDFAPVTLVATVPNVLIVNTDFARENRIATVADLVAYARKNPGKVNFGSGGNGSAGHLAGEMLKAGTNVFMVHIPYPGAAPATLGLLSRQTDFMFDNLASAAPRIREGRVKALAVTTRGRARAFPELPTMIEAGIADFDVNTWFGVFAPAGTPADIIAKLNHDMVAALRSDAMAERMAVFAAEPSPGTPDELASLVKSDLRKYAIIVKKSGASVD